jgi:hypothetical protein
VVRGTLCAVALLTACGSKKAQETPAKDAAVVRKPDASVAAPVAVDAGPGGTVKVKVEWKDAPAEVRASAGRDACGDERPGQARVHTLHGIADAVVWIEGGASPERAPALVTLRRCHLEPRVQLGGELRVRSLVEERVKVEVKAADAIDGAPAALASFEIPLVGNTVTVPARPWLMHVTTDHSPDPAWVVVAPVEFAAVTDESGAARFDGVTEGDHAIVAWLPPSRMVRGTVTVKRGEVVEVTLSIAPGGGAPADPAPADPEPEP